jgi:hypothetical protein
MWIIGDEMNPFWKFVVIVSILAIIVLPFTFLLGRIDKSIFLLSLFSSTFLMITGSILALPKEQKMRR